MGRNLNENPGEFVSDEVTKLNEEIARLTQENADLQAHVDNLKGKLDACLAQLPETSSV